MKHYPHGSEWRKWDLHVHVPGTKLSDGYDKKEGEPDFDRFAVALEHSDVAVFGITDYFSADQSIAFIEYFKEKYPASKKLFLVNIELRLNETVNRDAQMVDFHVIFRDSVSDIKINDFLSRLTTQITDENGRAKNCTELTNREYSSATVTRAGIKTAFNEAFGHKAEETDFLIYVAPANNNGLRAQSGQQRKANIADEIDKKVHAIFGKDPSNRKYFLSTDRYEDESQPSKPKPVFGGCDAHNFTDLENWLGKSVSGRGTRQVVTWIKADPTFEGLQQTLIEPVERVSIETTEPDQKEPYKVISKVKFSGTTEFPSEVVFNKNLNAIIGSRSSGKSALLAHISYAIDPEETVRLQVEAHGLSEPSKAGPAAGFSWEDVSDVNCEVEWGSGENTVGKVIYIPQNSLYSLSEQPEEITKKITPALFRTYPVVKTAYDSAMGKVNAGNTKIKNDIDEWFELADRIDERAQEIKDLGDKGAITAEKDRLEAEIDRIKAATQLTDGEVAKYQEVAGLLDSQEARLKEIEVEFDQLRSYVRVADVTTNPTIIPQAVQATVSVRPSDIEIPERVATRIEQIKVDAVKDLIAKVEAELVEALSGLTAEHTSLHSDIELVKLENSELIAKHQANAELSRVVNDHKKQVASLEHIAKGEAILDKMIAAQDAAAARVAKSIIDRDEALSALMDTFNAEERILTDLKFGIETDFPAEAGERISTGFNRRNINDYVKSRGDSVSYSDAQVDPKKFLVALRGGKIALNKNYELNMVAADVLTVTKEVRFSAELDSDRIGGFSRSSMTPGKQALFALTLILNESQEPWPLLIDQPEDDLDSRSIYDTIVPYLTERKKERQIIMVSHNANLVIGADSEQVIVANRHGDDRKNKNARTFAYFTGALEHSRPFIDSVPTALERCGVREHACEILDGGEVAFQKRRNKYNI